MFGRRFGVDLGFEEAGRILERADGRDPHVAVPLIDQARTLHPNLSILPEERRAEAAERPPQSELAVLPVADGSDHVGGKTMEGQPRLHQRGRRRRCRQTAAAGEPPLGQPVGVFGSG